MSRIQGRLQTQGYGISTSDEGLLAWDWVNEQMSQARNYWICSTRPDGKPHTVPVWAVWMDETLYFSCGRTSRKAKNLAINPAVAIHLESGDDAVILEGVVQELTDRALLTRVIDIYAVKYPPFKPNPDDPDNIFYALKPHITLAWQERDFPNTATRWIDDEA